MKTILVVLLSFSLAACVFISRRLDVQSISTRAPVTVASPVKAHLKDGSTVVYPWGVAVTADALVGEGARHDSTLKNSTTVERVELSEVLGLESYRTRTNGAESFLVSSLATAGAVVGTALLAVAIFGSCPTVYSDDGEVEEAELFSSSIAPLFEGRDIDRLHAKADARGIVTLDIRNEAMETHYINHLQLLAVEHGPGEVVVPDSHGTPIVVGTPRPAATATSRDGRDLRDARRVSPVGTAVRRHRPKWQVGNNRARQHERARRQVPPDESRAAFRGRVQCRSRASRALPHVPPLIAGVLHGMDPRLMGPRSDGDRAVHAIRPSDPDGDEEVGQYAGIVRTAIPAGARPGPVNDRRPRQ
ncbi:MAG: hypothetical protein LC753_16705 [Acidobacteria bacterium]|nr:hypothetical protein [Acidobacteriota bacterium]MCA1651832.1 hypothetical protein [Acidobacteriota bacterium]